MRHTWSTERRGVLAERYVEHEDRGGFTHREGNAGIIEIETEMLRLAERVRELEAERDRAWDRVVRERDRADKVPSAALCSCRRPASCLGAYEGCAVEFSCDVCCGHGNEDGWCVPVAEAPVRIAALEAENVALREENGKLEASVLASARARDEAMASKRGEAIAARIDGRRGEARRVRRALLELIEDSPAGPPHLYRGTVDELVPPEP